MNISARKALKKGYVLVSEDRWRRMYRERLHRMREVGELRQKLYIATDTIEALEMMLRKARQGPPVQRHEITVRMG